MGPERTHLPGSWEKYKGVCIALVMHKTLGLSQLKTNKEKSYVYVTMWAVHCRVSGCVIKNVLSDYFELFVIACVLNLIR